MKLHELLEKRSAAVVAMRALADTAETEKRDLTEAETGKFADLKKEITGLDGQIERAKFLAEAERAAPAVVHSGRLGDGAYEQRARSFSVCKAIAAQLGEPVDTGFEREISAEVRRRTGRSYAGIAVPDEYFHIERRALGDNVMLSDPGGSPPGAAAVLYPTQHRPDLFIDLMRAALVTGRLGATVLDGLVGDQEIPRQTGSATAQWVAEDEALTDTGLTFDDISMSPKTIGAIANYSRRAAINANPSIEAIVRRDLAAIVGNAIDLAAMLGDGTGNKPLGVIKQAAVNELSLVTLTWERVLEFPATIAGMDADVGGMGWAMSPWAQKRLRAAPREDIIPSAYMMESATSLAGYPAAITTALPGDASGSPATPATVIFGAWSQLLIGYWSGLDLLVNPYETQAYQRGRVLIRVMRDVDVAVRHGQSFAYADDLATTAPA